MTEQEERWLPIPGYEGRYSVSDHGRVRSGDTLLRQFRTPRYLTVTLGGKQRRVHQLVLLAFVGPRPEGMHTRHLDGNPDNNRLSNLTYGTPSENVLDKVRHGRHPFAKKTHCKHGHEFTEENTRYSPEGWRNCRKCSAIHSARATAKRSSPCVVPGCDQVGKAARGMCWKHYHRARATQGD